MPVDHAREPPFERLRNDIFIAIGALEAIGNPMITRVAQGLYEARALLDAAVVVLDAAEGLTPEAVARLVAMAEFRELADAIVAFRATFKVGGDNADG